MGIITERERQKYFAYLNGVADGLNESRNDVDSVLDRIKAEIEHLGADDNKAFCKSLNASYKQGLKDALNVLNKYKAEVRHK